MIPGYFYLRQRIPLMLYVIYRISEHSGINPKHTQKITSLIVTLVASYVGICFGGYVFGVPLSRFFPYNWSYEAIITWGIFFIVFYVMLERVSGDNAYAFNLAFQSVVAAGWFHEISYYHPLSMFISPNAIFGVSSQIIALLIVAYEIKKKGFKATPELLVTTLFYGFFSLVVARDVNIFRRVLWVYRIPTGLMFLTLIGGVGLRKKGPEKIKVLHLWNTAGIAGNIAQKMDGLYKTRSHVMMRAAGDPFKVIVKGRNYEDRAAVYVLRCLATAPFYDVIHVHGLEKIVPLIKVLFGWKPVMLHYHGTNIRGLWAEKKKYWKYADEIFVSTPDLLEGAPEKAIYIPNVVNEKMLDGWKLPASVAGSAFHDSRWADAEARKFAQAHGYEITEYSRTLTEGLPHEEFIKILSGYEAYIDVKRDFPGYGKGEILRAHSLTGLEALYLGLRVIRWDGELIEGFPKRHRAKSVVTTLFEIYGRYVK